MNNKKIYILTGPIQSGKTTKLIQSLADKKDVFGILTPIINSKRVFMNASTKEQFQMEAGPDEEKVLQIGRFVFCKKAFDKANGILKNAIKERKGWIIVDEIGPLELKGEGFHELITGILNSKTNLSILFVIRNRLLDEVMRYYGITPTDVTLVDKNAVFFQQ